MSGLGQHLRLPYELIPKKGGNIVDVIGKYSPFPLHWPGYEALGPGDNTDLDIERGIKPINKLDELARVHDIDYANTDDLKERHEADYRLQKGAWKRVIDPNAKLDEKIPAYITTNVMKFKRWLGLGINKKFYTINMSGLGQHLRLPGELLPKKALNDQKKEKRKKEKGGSFFMNQKTAVNDLPQIMENLHFNNQKKEGKGINKVSGYIKYPINPDKEQLHKINIGAEKGVPVILNLRYENLIRTKDSVGNQTYLPLIRTQVNQIEKAKISRKDLKLKLNKTQLKQVKKCGFIPAILAGLGALAAVKPAAEVVEKAVDIVTKGISNIKQALDNKKANDELVKERKRRNEKLQNKSGEGLGNKNGVKKNGSGVKKKNSSIKKNGTGVKKKNSSVKKNGTGVKKNGAGVKKNGLGVKKKNSSVKKNGTGVKKIKKGVV